MPTFLGFCTLKKWTEAGPTFYFLSPQTIFLNFRGGVTVPASEGDHQTTARCSTGLRDDRRDWQVRKGT